MSAKGGKTLLLQKEDPTNPGTYITIGGLKSKSIKSNNGDIDCTNHGSNEWKELLDGAGIRSMSISGSGVFTTDANLKECWTAHLAGTLTNFRVLDTDAGGLTFTGKWKIGSMEYGGEYDKDQTYSLSLASSGAITVA